ncbi:MAG TPA: hypothetical protein EYP43_02895 [Thermoplasmata archaeon]|nr:hypothetical protein [Thermoplasmata archaeon]
MAAVTVDSLTRAIQNSMGERKLEWEEARRIAEHVMNFFGYGNRIIDNILEPEDRDIFYMMEDSGILTTDREETTLHDGREWRIHYWTFHADRIHDLVRTDFFETETPETNIYDEIFNDEQLYTEMFGRREAGAE